MVSKKLALSASGKLALSELYSGVATIDNLSAVKNLSNRIGAIQASKHRQSQSSISRDVRGPGDDQQVADSQGQPRQVHPAGQARIQVVLA